MQKSTRLNVAQRAIAQFELFKPDSQNEIVCLSHPLVLQKYCKNIGKPFNEQVVMHAMQRYEKLIQRFDTRFPTYTNFLCNISKNSHFEFTHVVQQCDLENTFDRYGGACIATVQEPKSIMANLFSSRFLVGNDAVAAAATSVMAGMAHVAFVTDDPICAGLASGAVAIRFGAHSETAQRFGIAGMICRTIEDAAYVLSKLQCFTVPDPCHTKVTYLNSIKVAIEHVKESWYKERHEHIISTLNLHANVKQVPFQSIVENQSDQTVCISVPLPQTPLYSMQEINELQQTVASIQSPAIALPVTQEITNDHNFYVPIPVCISSTRIASWQHLFVAACAVSKAFPVREIICML